MKRSLIPLSFLLTAGIITSALAVTPGAPVKYGGETYETVVIGEQTWFKRNLNIVPKDGYSICSADNPARCERYGRLYDWATAMAIPSSCERLSCYEGFSYPHQGICPKGWHIPTRAEWQKLIYFVIGCESGECLSMTETESGVKLKAVDAWNRGGDGTDDYGFSALPGGSNKRTDIGGPGSDVGFFGYWWMADKPLSMSMSAFQMGSSNGTSGDYRGVAYSVRCLKD
jgi:uncharacterized protein (TIGR02145 family)